MAKKDEGAFFPEESDIESLITVLKEIEVNTHPRDDGNIPKTPQYEDFTKNLGNLDLIVPMGFVMLHNDLEELIKVYSTNKSNGGTSGIISAVGSSAVSIISALASSEIIKSLLEGMTLEDIVDQFVRLGNWFLGDSGSGEDGVLTKIGETVTGFASSLSEFAGSTAQDLAVTVMNVKDVLYNEDIKEQRQGLLEKYIETYFKREIQKLGYDLIVNDDGTFDVSSNKLNSEYIKEEAYDLASYIWANVKTGGGFSIVDASVNLVARGITEIGNAINAVNLGSDVQNAIINSYIDMLETSSENVDEMTYTLGDVVATHLEKIINQMNKDSEAFELDPDNITALKANILSSFKDILPTIIEVSQSSVNYSGAGTKISSFVNNIFDAWVKQSKSNSAGDFNLQKKETLIFGITYKDEFEAVRKTIIKSLPSIIKDIIISSGRNAVIDSSYITNFLGSVIDNFNAQADKGAENPRDTKQNGFYLLREDTKELIYPLMSHVGDIVEDAVPYIKINSNDPIVSDLKTFLEKAWAIMAESFDASSVNELETLNGLWVDSFESLVSSLGSTTPVLFNQLYKENTDLGIDTSTTYNALNNLVTKYYSDLASSSFIMDDKSVSTLNTTFAKEFGKKMASLATESAIADSVSLDNQISVLLKTTYDDTKMIEAVSSVTEKLKDLETKMTAIISIVGNRTGSGESTNELADVGER